MSISDWLPPLLISAVAVFCVWLMARLDGGDE